jgi:hypothetical protein
VIARLFARRPLRGHEFGLTLRGADSLSRVFPREGMTFPLKSFRGVIWRMAEFSKWHSFDLADRSTYPKVNAPIEVRDAMGAMYEGDFLKLVSEARQLLKPKITGWRYVRDKSIN